MEQKWPGGERTKGTFLLQASGVAAGTLWKNIRHPLVAFIVTELGEQPGISCLVSESLVEIVAVPRHQ